MIERHKEIDKQKLPLSMQIMYTMIEMGVKIEAMRQGKTEKQLVTEIIMSELAKMEKKEEHRNE